MSIRIKLILSYIAMVLVPVILTTIAAILILSYFAGASIRGKDMDRDFLSRITEKASSVYAGIGDTIQNNPDRLRDTAYIEGLDKELNILNTGIIIKKDDGVSYSSKHLNDPGGILGKLQESMGRDSIKQHNFIMFERRAYAVYRWDVTFTDRSTASVYTLTDVSPVGQFARNYFSSLFNAILIILVLTNGLLTYFVSKSILKPLKLLKYGTEQIKDGNLNFELKTESKDEIGQVCKAFEQMRLKLKESIDMQLQYEENRKELISSISHDLKTPITAIKGYVEGIMDRVADTPEKTERYINTIYKKATDMDRLVDDLFMFSKLDLKKLPFNFERVDVGRFFEDCTGELNVDMEKQGIHLTSRMELAEKVLVVADREKLKRVVMNIMDNAVKYMDKQIRKIEMALEDGEDFVTVRISDNGQGISEKELPLIFDRFYRTDASRSSATGGTGLGLAIARQIIEGHGGRIWAESTYGKGSTVNFTLRKVTEDGTVRS